MEKIILNTNNFKEDRSDMMFFAREMLTHFLTSVVFISDIITTPWKLAELMFFVFVNMCIVQGILRPDIIK